MLSEHCAGATAGGGGTAATGAPVLEMKLGSSEGGGTLDNRLPEVTAVTAPPPGDDISDGLDDILLREPAHITNN